MSRRGIREGPGPCLPSCHNITRRVGGTVPKIGPSEREITRLDLLLRRPLPSISLGPLTFTEGDLGMLLQGSAKRRSPGLVKFVTALAYRFCLALPTAFTQLGDHLLAEPCTLWPCAG